MIWARLVARILMGIIHFARCNSKRLVKIAQRSICLANAAKPISDCQAGSGKIHRRVAGQPVRSAQCRVICDSR